MSEFDSRQLLTQLYPRLRQSGFNLGVSELLAALHAVDGGWGTADLDELAEVTRLLWCKSAKDEAEFSLIWETVLPISTSAKPDLPGTAPRPELPPPSTKAESAPSLPPPDPSSLVELPQSELAAFPIQVPFIPARTEGGPTIHTYWPISRRFMVYAWRYLRRPVPDGPTDVLDVATTVEQAARQGFFLAPVYRRRERNYAHLILLIDQGGSMAPLHRFTRDLVETAQYDSNLETVESFYFHNIPADNLYYDPHLTQPVPLFQVLDHCISDTSLLVVSDAGAARGRRRLERIQATARFLAQLKARTSLLAWLNPMPRVRWGNTSAQFIATLVRMFSMDLDGFSNAIDVLRGVDSRT